VGNPVTWFEIMGSDPDGTSKFYTELFGWHVESVPEMNYHMFDTHSGSGINGAVGQAREGQPPGSVFYVEDPDIQALLDKAESLGGKTIVPVTEIPDMVTFAQFMDPFGNAIGLVKGDGNVRVSEGSNPPVDWFEYGTTEPEKAWDFYRELFGWKIEGSSSEGYVHGGVDAGSGIHGGIGSSPTGRPHVTMYASVDDLAKYLERAESLGGKTVMQPMKVDEHTTISVFLDPQGTMFGIYSSTD
jgi:predicted enzyme related to lactoylglutathione lyase